MDEDSESPLDDASGDALENIQDERRQLERGGRVHYVHWLVVIGSLVITMTAWRLSADAVEERSRLEFSRQADHVVERIAERMQSYEDALWAGVSLFAASNAVSNEEWQTFSRSMRLTERYPGINGIGVIFNVPSVDLPAFVQGQRDAGRPEFRAYPSHDKPVSLPITYIEPIDTNRAALGLDMAHETNRFTAALRARDTGDAQITGPIQLVQDMEKTPGFLFSAPFYGSKTIPSNQADRKAQFQGLVYAPFIVHKLLDGTLDRERRLVGVSIQDGAELMYNEHVPEEPDYDEVPLHTQLSEVEMYGRTWLVEVHSAKSFRAAHSSSQPWVVLAAGIFIDALLLFIFLALARSNRKALGFASRLAAGYDARTQELEAAVGQLRNSNSELEQFAYIASHDLQEPLRTLSSFSTVLEAEIVRGQNTNVDASVKYIGQAAARMRSLVSALLDFSRIGVNSDVGDVDCDALMATVIADLGGAIEACDAEIEIAPMGTIRICGTEIRQLFQNLLSNALKFVPEGTTPKIQIGYDSSLTLHRFFVKDNGIGIDPKFKEKIFRIFQRLHGTNEYVGSGIGLANCKKIVSRHGGEIWVESEPGQGATFFFTLNVRGPKSTIQGSKSRVHAEPQPSQP